MAIEKMKLVKISGSLTKLYDLSARLCESEFSSGFRGEIHIFVNGIRTVC